MALLKKLIKKIIEFIRMATKITPSGRNLKIELEPKKSNRQLSSGAYTLIDLEEINASHINVAVETIASQGKKGIRVTNSGVLPITSPQTRFTILYTGYQGDAPAIVNWVEIPIVFDEDGNFSILIENTLPLAFYRIKLRIYEPAGSKDMVEKSITTPDDTLFVSIQGMLSDDVVSQAEKPLLKLLYNQRMSAKQGLLDSAAAWGSAAATEVTAYTNAINALEAFFTSYPTILTMDVDTSLGAGNGAVMSTKFNDVDVAASALQKKVDALIKEQADSLYGSDTFTPDKKRSYKLQLSMLLQEQAKLDQDADNAAISRTSYDAAILALKSHLATIGGWNSVSLDWYDYISSTNLGAGGAATLQTKMLDVYTERTNLTSALTNAARETGDYAQTISRDSLNLIKNGNSEMGLEAKGIEANGLVNEPANAFVGSWCRKVLPNSAVFFSDKVPCAESDEFFCEAKAKVVGATGQGNLYCRMGTGDTTVGYAGTTFTNTSYETVSFSATVPAGCTWIQFYSDCNALTAGAAYFDNLYAAKRISAGMLQSDIAITGCIRSPNYVAGSGGSAPVGFMLAGTPFSSTLKDGTSINANLELGAAANIGGFQVGALTNAAFGGYYQSGAAPQNFTFTVPDGITKLKVTLVGGGGAGAGATLNTRGGGGGASGEYKSFNIAVSPGDTFQVIVPDMAIGGAAATDGANGGTVSFGSYSALGGEGGKASGLGGGGTAIATAGAYIATTEGFTTDSPLFGHYVYAQSIPGGGGGNTSGGLSGRGGSVWFYGNTPLYLPGAYDQGTGNRAGGGGASCYAGAGGNGCDNGPGFTPSAGVGGGGGGGGTTATTAYAGGNGRIGFILIEW